MTIPSIIELKFARPEFKVLGMRPFVFVVTLATITFGWNFWGTSIYMLDEAKNAGSAWEMLQSNNFFVPTFNGEFHDKPALQYFFMAAGYVLFGFNSFGARIFSVLMGVLCVAGIFHFTSKNFNKQTAFFASLIYISSLQMAVQFRMAVPDPYLLCCLTLGWLSFYHGYRFEEKKYLFVFYALIGLAFVAKGPIAFALTGLTVLLFLLSQRELTIKKLIALQLPIGAFITLAVALPWYIGSGVATNWAWPEYFFITHNLDRYVNTFEGHGGFPFDTVVIVFAALLPSSVLMPQAIVHAFRKRNENKFNAFALSVFIAVTGFFLFSKTVLPSYPAPCIAFVAIMIAGYIFSSMANVNTSVAMRVSSIVALVVCAALPVAAWFALQQDPLLTDLKTMSLFFIPASMAAAVATWFIFSNKPLWGLYSWTGGFIVTMMLLSSFVLPTVDAQNPVANSFDLFANTDRKLAYYKRINSAYVFYNKKPIPKLDTPEQLSAFTRQHKDVMIITTMSDWEELNAEGYEIVFRSKDLFETPESVIVVSK